MPELKISKVKPRRGTKAQLDITALDQGEIVSTTDTKRVYIGSGSGYGGSVVGNRIHSPIINYFSLSTLVSEIGDIVLVNNIFYQLTATNYANVASWANVGPKLDPTILQYNASNGITVIPSSLSAGYINPTTVLSGIKIQNGILQLNIDPSSLQLSANKLGLRPSGVSEREVVSTSFGGGIVGGSGGKISLDVDTNHFYFDTNTLKISSLPSSFFGAGLVYNSPTLSASLASVDETTLTKNLSGEISSKVIGVSTSNQLASISTDVYGRVTVNQSAIFDVLTGNSTLSPANSSNSLSCIFNGSPAQTITGTIPGIELAYFTALSSNGMTVSLSSAGFILFSSPSTTQSGQVIGRFAIPIFSY
jgi:hypothetical protein